MDLDMREVRGGVEISTKHMVWCSQKLNKNIMFKKNLKYALSIIYKILLQEVSVKS